MISSELLDVGSLPTAGGSMRRPRPQQHRSVGREDVGDVRLTVATDVVDDEIGERVAVELRGGLDRRCERAATDGSGFGLGGRGLRGRCPRWRTARSRAARASVPLSTVARSTAPVSSVGSALVSTPSVRSSADAVVSVATGSGSVAVVAVGVGRAARGERETDSRDEDRNPAGVHALIVACVPAPTRPLSR